MAAWPDANLPVKCVANGLVDILSVPPPKGVGVSVDEYARSLRGESDKPIPPNGYIIWDQKSHTIRHNNAKKNTHKARKRQGYKFRQSDTVIMVGAGAVPDIDLEALRNLKKEGGATIVTLGRAQRDYVQGHYYCGEDPYECHVPNVSGCDNSQTIAHLGLATYPEVRKAGWRDVTWFGVRWGHNLDIPRYYDGTSVGVAALQFIAKKLKAKKIVLLGLEHSLTKVPDGSTSGIYYEAGIYIQAACWWISQHRKPKKPYNIRIYNCSVPTTVLAGVVLGDFRQVLKEPIDEEG